VDLFISRFLFCISYSCVKIYLIKCEVDKLKHMKLAHEVRLAYEIRLISEVVMERTLIILKPDAVRRKLVGEIISRFERKGYSIQQIKIMSISREIAEIHYNHVRTEPIFEDMMSFITSGPVVAMIIEGNSVIQSIRNMIGKTSSFDSPPGTIRGDYGSHRFENLIHASDSIENAEIEIKRFFSELS